MDSKKYYYFSNDDPKSNDHNSVWEGSVNPRFNPYEQNYEKLLPDYKNTKLSAKIDENTSVKSVFCFFIFRVISLICQGSCIIIFFVAFPSLLSRYGCSFSENLDNTDCGDESMSFYFATIRLVFGITSLILGFYLISSSGSKLIGFELPSEINKLEKFVNNFHFSGCFGKFIVIITIFAYSMNIMLYQVTLNESISVINIYDWMVYPYFLVAFVLYAFLFAFYMKCCSNCVDLTEIRDTEERNSYFNTFVEEQQISNDNANYFNIIYIILLGVYWILGIIYLIGSINSYFSDYDGIYNSQKTFVVIYRCLINILLLLKYPPLIFCIMFNLNILRRYLIFYLLSFIMDTVMVIEPQNFDNASDTAMLVFCWLLVAYTIVYMIVGKKFWEDLKNFFNQDVYDFFAEKEGSIMIITFCINAGTILSAAILAEFMFSHDAMKYTYSLCNTFHKNHKVVEALLLHFTEGSVHTFMSAAVKIINFEFFVILIIIFFIVIFRMRYTGTSEDYANNVRLIILFSILVSVRNDAVNDSINEWEFGFGTITHIDGIVNVVISNVLVKYILIYILLTADLMHEKRENIEKTKIDASAAKSEISTVVADNTQSISEQKATIGNKEGRICICHKKIHLILAALALFCFTIYVICLGWIKIEPLNNIQTDDETDYSNSFFEMEEGKCKVVEPSDPERGFIDGWLSLRENAKNFHSETKEFGEEYSRSPFNTADKLGYGFILLLTSIYVFISNIVEIEHFDKNKNSYTLLLLFLTIMEILVFLLNYVLNCIFMMSGLYMNGQIRLYKGAFMFLLADILGCMLLTINRLDKAYPLGVPKN